MSKQVLKQIVKDRGLQMPKHKKYVSRLGSKTLWYFIDLDATLAEPVWQSGSHGIGAPIKRNIEKLMEVHNAGFKIIIHTSRAWYDYEAIERWLTDHEIPFKGIVCGKPLGHRYVDDKAISAEDATWLK